MGKEGTENNDGGERGGGTSKARGMAVTDDQSGRRSVVVSGTVTWTGRARFATCKH